MCIPNIDDLRNWILEEAHRSRYLIHPGSTKMYHDLSGVFLWDGFENDIANFVAKCAKFQQVKSEPLKLSGLLDDIQNPTWKWEDINMDFIVGLPKTPRYHHLIWVVVDSLTKSAQFIPVKSTYMVQDCAKLYVEDILSLHGITVSIISDRGTQFTSNFWKLFQKGLGIRVKLSTTFQVEMECQVERTIETLEDMIRVCVIDFNGSWYENLALV